MLSFKVHLDIRGMFQTQIFSTASAKSDLEATKMPQRTVDGREILVGDGLPPYNPIIVPVLHSQ